MGFAENMRILSNINCGLASFNTMMEQRSNGVNYTTTGLTLGQNLSNGIIRNEMAYDMQKHGNPVGNLVNMYAGYGTPEANTAGTLGMMSAYMCNPWGFFNSPLCSYMCGPMSMTPYMSMGMPGYYGGFMSMGMMPSMGCWC